MKKITLIIAIVFSGMLIQAQQTITPERKRALIDYNYSRIERGERMVKAGLIITASSMVAVIPGILIYTRTHRSGVLIASGIVMAASIPIWTTGIHIQRKAVKDIRKIRRMKVEVSINSLTLNF